MILAWEDSAEPVAAYLYLAYGKLYSDLSDFYGTSTLYDPYVFDCPIMYAGQYYDYETDLYYLRARYYSPDLCRFTSEDPIKDGLNWYAYCAGNPVIFMDKNGNSIILTAILATVALAAVGAAIGAGVNLVTQLVNGGEIDRKSVGASAAAGAVTGALAPLTGGASLGIAGTMLVGGALGIAGYGVYNTVYGSDPTIEGTIMSFGFGSVLAGLGHYLSNAGSPTTLKPPSQANTSSKGTSKAPNLTRNVTKASELDENMLGGLKNEGTIKSGGRSGGNRPLTGTPNSYAKTDAGHTLVYDGNGRLIYDISSGRVKMTVWDIAPNGNMYPRDVKLEGPVPGGLLK